VHVHQEVTGDEKSGRRRPPEGQRLTRSVMG
jgi:hypothetical protein